MKGDFARAGKTCGKAVKRARRRQNKGAEEKREWKSRKNTWNTRSRKLDDRQTAATTFRIDVAAIGFQKNKKISRSRSRKLDT